MTRDPALLALALVLASCAGIPPTPSEPTVAESKAQGLPAAPIEGKRVSEVAIRYTLPIDIDPPRRLRSYIGTHSGGTYSDKQVDSDIKALYESGYVDKVRVLAEPSGDEVLLIYEVTPRASLFSGR
ncbi:POTRA domain-containing protein [Haloferula sp. BvORR071]|uniref:POTRA domain-containing protein n=1 Tax=Haloferula sp. BvORR071 TaxID=1396141 RepID=UPI0005533F00|nr:POTRA domain-containing protein [Haloferula sp. BvORR071]